MSIISENVAAGCALRKAKVASYYKQVSQCAVHSNKFALTFPFDGLFSVVFVGHLRGKVPKMGQTYQGRRRLDSGQDALGGRR